MNKKGEINLTGWSAAAVAVGMSGFLAYTGLTGWAIFFAILGIILAILPLI